MNSADLLHFPSGLPLKSLTPEKNMCSDSAPPSSCPSLNSSHFHSDATFSRSVIEHFMRQRKKSKNEYAVFEGKAVHSQQELLYLMTDPELSYFQHGEAFFWEIILRPWSESISNSAFDWYRFLGCDECWEVISDLVEKSTTHRFFIKDSEKMYAKYQGSNTRLEWYIASLICREHTIDYFKTHGDCTAVLQVYSPDRIIVTDNDSDDRPDFSAWFRQAISAIDKHYHCFNLTQTDS